MASRAAQEALEARAGRLLVGAGFEGGAVGGCGVGRGPVLGRAGHARFSESGLGPLSKGFMSLDSSRTWVAFWCLHSLNLLGEELPDVPPRTAGPEAKGSPTPTEPAEGAPPVFEEEAPAGPVSREALGEFLLSCQAPGGGFGGTPGQLAHLGSTYAALAALASLGGDWVARADRESHLGFIQEMQIRETDPGSVTDAKFHGGFCVHVGGEIDTRGCYCAMAAAAFLGVDLEEAEVEAMTTFVCRCQSYEGGLGGEPGNEAHGGYTYCGVAALALAGRLHRLDLPRLLRWVVARQRAVEGGFNGRTNKLADGCYSFWQGGLMCILQGSAEHLFAQMPLARLPSSPPSSPSGPPTEIAPGPAAGPQDGETPEKLRAVERGALFDTSALQAWLLVCCQHKSGGLRDKPGLRPDFYHTCYCLSGLSLSQRFGGAVLGPRSNSLRENDALLNVCTVKLRESRSFLGQSPPNSI